MFGISVGSRSSQNAKALILPLGIFIFIGIAIIGVGFYAYGQISEQYEILKDSQSEEESLRVKHNTLSEIETSNLDASNRSVIAMPEGNPGLFMLSQLKSLAQKHALPVLDSSVQKEALFDGDLTRSKVVVTIKSDSTDPIIAYIKEIQELAPLSTLERVDISGDYLDYETVVEVYVYWAPFPTNLPAFGESITHLSSNDQEVLSKISSLTVPMFTVLNPTDPSGRVDPFQ